MIALNESKPQKEGAEDRNEHVLKTRIAAQKAAKAAVAERKAAEERATAKRKADLKLIAKRRRTVRIAGAKVDGNQSEERINANDDAQTVSESVKNESMQADIAQRAEEQIPAVEESTGDFIAVHFGENRNRADRRQKIEVQTTSRDDATNISVSSKGTDVTMGSAIGQNSATDLTLETIPIQANQYLDDSRKKSRLEAERARVAARKAQKQAELNAKKIIHVTDQTSLKPDTEKFSGTHSSADVNVANVLSTRKAAKKAETPEQREARKKTEKALRRASKLQARAFSSLGSVESGSELSVGPSLFTKQFGKPGESSEEGTAFEAAKNDTPEQVAYQFLSGDMNSSSSNLSKFASRS